MDEEILYPGYTEGNVYKFSQLSSFIYEACDEFGIDLVSRGKIEYLNIPCAFDIETTSIIQKDENDIIKHKSATMYIWQFGMNGSVIYGRYWDEFFQLLSRLDEYLELSKFRRLVIYVHNLMFEFAFIRKWIEWDKVFAPKNRRPIYAIAGGFEFRCSYFLSNMSLAYIGKEMLHKYPIQKMVGDLDYSLSRNSETPLTEKELGYCINDVKVLMSFIQEKIETDGDITKIPYTNTGYVRNFCRERSFFSTLVDEEERNRNSLNYHALMKSLTIDSIDEYRQLKRAFMGGFTHASMLHVNKIHKGNIGSADLTSSYPYAMCAQYFPMSKAEYIGDIKNVSEFEHYLENYCCLFDIEFHNIRCIVDYENYLPYSKAYFRDKAHNKIINNNNRVYSATHIGLTITELDFDIINRIYEWNSFEITNMRIYEKGYLPKDLILAILDLYSDKTTLKGLPEKIVEYMVKKNMINASYGMMVTDIIREMFEYEGEWSKSTGNDETQLDKYNKSYSRFLFYPWGIWTTAHARHNIWQAIREFGNDYIYCDTDSIKGFNFDNHKKFFNDYNLQVRLSLLDMCNHYKINVNKCSPITNKGVPKLLGEFEIEEGYIEFKTSGAKRYIYRHPDGFVNLTASGINKKLAMPYLICNYNNIPFDSEEYRIICKAYQDDKEAKEWVIAQNYDYGMIFEVFGDYLYIPEEYSGKLASTYNDNEEAGMLADYQGNVAFYHELSSLCITKVQYFMNMDETFIKFLNHIETLVN